MKYIIFENKLYGSYPVIFPDFFNHNDIKLKIDHQVISAGFCKIVDNKFEVYGEAKSLKLISRPEDEQLLNLMKDI
jgi:hypothetical protein